MTSSKAIFIRVSRDDLSYEKQIPVILRQFNLRLDECVVYKEKISAYKEEVQDKREDYKKLVNDIEMGIIKELYVFKIDRLQRNIERSLSFYFFCKSCDCNIYSASEPHLNIEYGDKAIGIYMRYNLVLATAFLGQAESENTSIRTKSAIDKTSKKLTYSYKGNKWGKQFKGIDGENVDISQEELESLQKSIITEINKYEKIGSKGYYNNIIKFIEKKYKITLSKAYISLLKKNERHK